MLRLLNEISPELALKYKESLERYIREDMWSLYELIVNGTKEEVYTEYSTILNALELEKFHNSALYIKAKKLAECIVKNDWIYNR